METPARVHAELGAYSHIRHDGKGTYYISGQVPVEPDGSTVAPDSDSQARRVLANLGAVLASVGLTPADVVKLTAFLVDRNDRPALAAARTGLFDPPYPASTVIVVQGLLNQEWRFEVEAVAVRPGS